MKDVIDIAAYILSKTGDVSTMKLQKLVYYSQAYSLVRNDVPLFENRIEAWANGPVIPDLFQTHKKKYVVRLESMDFPRNPVELSEMEKICVDTVIHKLGLLSGAQLSELTHSEDPWQNSRRGLALNEPSKREITRESIKAYYATPFCNNCLFRTV